MHAMMYAAAAAAAAAAQVLALRLRSNALAGQPLPAAAAELDYPSLINKALPDTIRVLGWADAAPEFSARCRLVACICQLLFLTMQLLSAVDNQQVAIKLAG
jgi:tRNA U38,U39,U40 pseudouridine synthase TruA